MQPCVPGESLSSTPPGSKQRRSHQPQQLQSEPSETAHLSPSSPPDATVVIGDRLGHVAFRKLSHMVENIRAVFFTYLSQRRRWRSLKVLLSERTICMWSGQEKRKSGWATASLRRPTTTETVVHTLWIQSNAV